MNVLLWILQILLALWNVIGGIYTAGNYATLLTAGWLNTLPGPVWMILGIVQALFALGLILPGATKVLPKATPVAAVYLALYALSGCTLFSAYAGFPGMLWGLVPALLLAFVAYGRTALKPF